MMKTSPTGIALIKQFEGLELEAYQDIAGIWTIGYGHTGHDVEPGKVISEREAEALLRRDLVSRERSVDDLTSADLNQNEFDALVSFVYNVGVGAYRGSTARRRLNAGDRVGAADALTWWNKATVDGVLRPVTGLTRRRAAERALFLTPVNVFAERSIEKLDDNSRVTPVEDPPRRENLAESRTIQAAAVAGGAGVASSTMGRSDATALSEMDASVENDENAQTTDRAGYASDTPNTASEPVEQAGAGAAGETTETIAVPVKRTLKQEQHVADAQIQLALMIVIVLAVFFIIATRIDDWLKYRR